MRTIRQWYTWRTNWLLGTWCWYFPGAEQHRRAHHRLQSRHHGTHIFLFMETESRCEVWPLSGSEDSRWWVNAFIIIIHSRPRHSIRPLPHIPSAHYPLAGFSPRPKTQMMTWPGWHVSRVTSSRVTGAHCLWVYNEEYSWITSLPRSIRRRCNIRNKVQLSTPFPATSCEM